MRHRLGLAGLLGLLAMAGGACGDGVDFEVVVEAVTPPSGPLIGGQTIVVTGAGFLDGAASPDLVLVGDGLAPSVRVVSDTELEVVTPPGTAPGPVTVVVFNQQGFAAAEGLYTYNAAPAITAIDPKVGPTAGGTEVTITGTGFQAGEAGSNLVYFGGVLSTEVTVTSDTEMVAVAPPSAALTLVSVSLANQNGGGELARAYAYLDPGLVECGFSAGFGGGIQTIKHLDPVTRQVRQIALLATNPGEFFSLDSLVYAGDGEFIGGGRDGQLHRVKLDGSHTPIGRLDVALNPLDSRAPALALHGGELAALVRDRGQSIVKLGTLSLDDASFEERALPGAPSRALGLASDGQTLWGLVRDSDSDIVSIFELDLEAGDTIEGTVVPLPSVSRVWEMTEYDGTIYIMASVSTVINVFGGGNQGIYAVDLDSGSVELISSAVQARGLAAVQ